MKVIIAGSRKLDHNERFYMRELEKLVDKFESQYGTITSIVSGTANGPDKLGERWAEDNGILIHKFPADWKRHKKAAGPIRNIQMGKFADGAIIMWDGESPGTRHMRDVMKELDKPFILDIFEPIHYNYDHRPDGTIEQFLGPKPKS